MLNASLHNHSGHMQMALPAADRPVRILWNGLKISEIANTTDHVI
jgi:hypothetical protein